jgi:spermidine synthase
LRRSIAFVCFFISGFAGLAYEICWIRKASLVFGSTTFALSTVLAVFFAGLAIGSWYFGRLGQRLNRPIRFYAFLEISLAVLAVLSLPAFGLAESLFGAIYRALTGDGGWIAPGSPVLILIRVLLISVVLLPPTILMGGTLPLFCRQFVVSRSNIAGMIGLLYGINTLGAALGAAATGFYLLPAIGVTQSIFLAAILNVVAGGLALALKLRNESPSVIEDTLPSEVPAADRSRLLIAGLLFFASGAVALGAELVWSRFLTLIVRNSVYTYTITLSVVLLGIVLGSVLAARIFDRRLPLAPIFAALQITTALLLLIMLWLPASFWRGLGQGWQPFVVLMLPPAILSGATFPLVMRLVLNEPGSSSAVVGRMSAFNIFGGISGSLLLGFLILPARGLAFSAQFIALTGILSGGAALLLLDRRSLWPRLVPLVLAATAFVLMPRLMPANLPADYLASPVSLVDFKEGHGSTLAAVRKEGALHLHIDRLWQGKNIKSHQIMAAHVPMFLHPEARDVLLIGVGVGQTPGRFLYHDIGRLDCVDIEPEIFDFIDEHFDTEWMQDPRVHLIADDGRSFSTHTARSYDMISIEVGQVFRPGVESFYTSQFYEVAKDHLNPDGLVAQFVPIAFLAEPEFRSILATFLDVFPQAVLWYNTNELLLIGGVDTPVTVKVPALRTLTSNRRLNRDLQWSHWGGSRHWLNRPENMLAGFLCGPDGLRALADGGAILSDDLPVLSYATSDALAAEAREAPLAELIGRHLSPLTDVLDPGVAITEDYSRNAEAVRRLNLADLQAAMHLRLAHNHVGAGRHPLALREIQLALTLNPQSFLAKRMMGQVLNLSRRQAEAVDYLRQAVAMRPDDHLAPRDLALSLMQTGQMQEAETLLSAHLQRWPDDAAGHNYMGAVYADSGRMNQALASFRRAVQLDPANPSAKANLQRLQGGALQP